MRIALVTGTYTPQVNGVTKVVVRIANVLRELGHKVAIVAPRYPGLLQQYAKAAGLSNAAATPFAA